MSEPTRTLTEEEVEKLQLQYYNTDVHRAAFTVPQFVKKVCTITSLVPRLPDLFNIVKKAERSLMGDD